jgi:hypothetical protein
MWIALLLSQYTSNGLDKSGTTSRSIRKFMIYATSFPALEAAKYSAFVVEPTCFLLGTLLAHYTFV